MVLQTVVERQAGWYTTYPTMEDREDTMDSKPTPTLGQGAVAWACTVGTAPKEGKEVEWRMNWGGMPASQALLPVLLLGKNVRYGLHVGMGQWKDVWPWAACTMAVV
jgi:hypothetical protein